MPLPLVIDLATAANPLQAVRLHYGISLELLAAYLAVSVPLVKQVATGRRDLPTAAYLRLRPLAEALPPLWGSGPLPLAPPADPPPALLPPPRAALAPAALQRRLASQRHCLLALNRELAALRQRRAQAEALRAVLPALAALAPLAAPATDWLARLQAQVAERLGPAAATTLALGEARRQALLLEEAQLVAWLLNE